MSEKHRWTENPVPHFGNMIGYARPAEQAGDGESGAGDDR